MKRPKRRKEQQEAFEFALANPYCILALDPRMGKSRVAIDVHEYRKKKHKVENCLIVCPGYLVENWRYEIEKWAGKRIVTVIHKGSEIYDLFDSDYAIISYDLAKKAENFFSWAHSIIIDEAHNLKNLEAQRTEFIHKQVYENSVPFLQELTGTPILNRVAEFYSPLALTYYDPSKKEAKFLDKFPTSIDFADYFSHRHEYTLEIGNRWVKVVKWVGMRNVKKLKKYLKGRYLRIKANEKDMPPVTFKNFWASRAPNEELAKAFNKMFKDEENQSVMSDVKARAAMATVPITIQYVKDLLEKIDTPVLIYTDHIDACEAFAKEFGTLALTGRITGKRRLRHAYKFNSGEGRVLTATIGALSVGTDLSRARDLVLNDPSWVPETLRQMWNRMRAVGLKDPCTVHRILGSPQSKSIYDALQDKIRVINKVT